MRAYYWVLRAQAHQDKAVIIGVARVVWVLWMLCERCAQDQDQGVFRVVGSWLLLVALLDQVRRRSDHITSRRASLFVVVCVCLFFVLRSLFMPPAPQLQTCPLPPPPLPSGDGQGEAGQGGLGACSTATLTAAGVRQS